MARPLPRPRLTLHLPTELEGTAEEIARVQDALDNHPERLADVLREIHDAHKEGGKA